MRVNELAGLRDLLVETAQREATIAALLQTGDQSFVMQLDSGIDIEADYLAETGRMALSAIIGTPADAERLRIYEAMLIYGLLWRDTGGVHMALAEPGGAVVQLAEIPAFDLTPGDLAMVVKNFEAKALIWVGLLEGEGRGEPGPNLVELGVRV
jgi:hypothetical protein